MVWRSRWRTFGLIVLLFSMFSHFAFWVAPTRACVIVTL